jgi:hypothetical protein
VIPRGKNQIADALATSALFSKFQFFLIKSMKLKSSIGQQYLITLNIGKYLKMTNR